jgi:uncharacterized protein (DUF2267 family)
MRANEFFLRVQHAGGIPVRREAERWSRAVLTALVDLLPDAETRRQFVTHVPWALKSPARADAPRALVLDHEALVQHVGAALDLHAPDAERVLRTVFSVLRGAISAGELEDFEAGIPKDVATFLAEAS